MAAEKAPRGQSYRIGFGSARGMVPPPAPALPVDLDLAVVGPMARTARDLTLLLDVMAGPDPLPHGLTYDVTLPPARHQRLCDFNVGGFQAPVVCAPNQTRASASVPRPPPGMRTRVQEATPVTTPASPPAPSQDRILHRYVTSPCTTTPAATGA
ncbi:amidase family protein [Nocardia vaccinii]|uniref:amidase family protein n=1 Tax=Nocardia vaccinii TaxID=1822 RepID=UPI0008307C88|nr:amidase family protein [Nocardia vaccinii]